MNVLFLLTTVTTTPFATTLTDLLFALVTLDTLEMEFFAVVNKSIYKRPSLKNKDNSEF
jgi:MinD superfamily P-loop ATPase